MSFLVFEYQQDGAFLPNLHLALSLFSFYDNIIFGGERNSIGRDLALDSGDAGSIPAVRLFEFISYF